MNIDISRIRHELIEPARSSSDIEAIDTAVDVATDVLAEKIAILDDQMRQLLGEIALANSVN